MTATVSPPESGTSPEPAPFGAAPDAPTRSAGPPTQLSHVFADLVPDEIIARRRLAHLKPRLGFALAALVVLLVLGYALAFVQTRNAKADLAGEQARSGLLNGQVNRFSHLVAVQNETGLVRGQLAGAMTGDLQWGRLLAAVQAKAPAGVRITGVDGSVLTGVGSDPSSSSDSSTVTLNPTGDAVAGSLSVTGTAPRYDSVAVLLGALGRVPGLVAANPATTAATTHGVNFTITLSITAKAPGGRCAGAAAAPAAGTGTGGN